MNTYMKDIRRCCLAWTKGYFRAIVIDFDLRFSWTVCAGSNITCFTRALSWSRVSVKGHMTVVFETDYPKVALEIERGCETDLWEFWYYGLHQKYLWWAHVVNTWSLVGNTIGRFWKLWEAAPSWRKWVMGTVPCRNAFLGHLQSRSLPPAYQDLHSCPHTMLLWCSACGHRTKQASSGMTNPDKPFLLYVVSVWSFSHRDLLSGASHLPKPGTTLWTYVVVILGNIQGIWRERKKIHVIFTLSNMNFILKVIEFVIC